MAWVWTCAEDNILIASPKISARTYWLGGDQAELRTLLANLEQFSIPMQVNNVSGPVAWVQGIDKTRRRKKTGEISSDRIYGTNIVNSNGRALMVFHQAAAIPRNS
jgi:hypothetical protein